MNCYYDMGPFSQRRYRAPTVAVAAILILSTIWLFSGHSLPNGPQSLDWLATAGQNSKPDASRLIPPKIWQILLSKNDGLNKKPVVFDADQLQDASSWLAMNADYTYTLMSDKKSDEFVSSHFANEPKIVETYKNLSNVGMKSDLLRYLILGTEGGVYTDTDTVALKPIDYWVPRRYRDKVRLIVGIEFDRRDGGAWADIPHWLQFCQWTIAAAPGHPVFRKMVERVLQSVDELSDKYNVPLDQLHPGSFEVMNSTGPAAWTDVVFEQLQEYDPSLESTKDLSFMTKPELYGDILVLTIDGFGMGQSHSHSTNDGTIPEAALMRHLFRGSWRDPEPEEHSDEDPVE